MASRVPSVGAGASDAWCELALTQAPDASVTVSATASETRERMRGVVTVSSMSGNGAHGALSRSAQNAVKPAHGCWCPMAETGFPLSIERQCPTPLCLRPLSPSYCGRGARGTPRHPRRSSRSCTRSFGARRAAHCAARAKVTRSRPRHSCTRRGCASTTSMKRVGRAARSFLPSPTDASTARLPPPMTPERWRLVDAILQAALACEPEQRDAVVAAACAGNEALRIEVSSLLAVHVSSADDFLERPAAESFGAPDVPLLAERLASALEGRYAIERQIARGGMARVFLAHDLRHGRRVALTVLREDLAAAVCAERVLAVIRGTASLQHPHILPLFDSGSADGLLWYAMPFIEGETLRSYLAREGPLPIGEAVRLAREIAEALDHAHVRGIVHRDVKPENVLLQDGHALVADFGIALALEQAGGERITRTGLTLGTPQYMAPEQAAGERVLDARVDVYALGAVLHEMLAGEPPFAAPTRQAVVRRMMHDLPPALVTRRPDVTPVVDAAGRKALAKRPDDRFPSAAAVAAVLVVPLDGGAAAPAWDGGRIEPRGRTVSPRAALHVAVATLAVGLPGGRLVETSSLVQPCD